MTPEALAALAARAYTHMAPWSAQAFADTLARPQALLTTVEHAFVLGLVVADEAEILALAADPTHQRKGLASRALGAFHTQAAARGARRVFLDVAEHNTPARAFYTRHGYEPAGRRKGYYRLARGEVARRIDFGAWLDRRLRITPPADPVRTPPAETPRCPRRRRRATPSAIRDPPRAPGSSSG